ncbi:MAG TPA: DUF1844 domain-containing protein [Nitrospiria bacterium]|nr:DUF1844 domain-containing protein [Candidatus Manganitrophaceae bacterium]HIL34541.1 DUF1844 domain-containing protein [Candidatus Manganitrophaceae bacterium]
MNEPGERTSEDKSSLEAKEKPDSSFEKKDSHQAAGTYPVNFSSFILSLATSALINLEEEANPATGEKSVQLPMARQVIDLLTLLEEKTQGNLSKDEAGLISQLLFTLRMKFVEMEKKAHS